MTEKKKSSRLTRREFTTLVVSAIGSVIGAFVGIPIIGYFVSPALKKQEGEDWISVGSLEQYPVGEPKLFTFTRTKVNGWERTTNSYGVYVYRVSDSDIRVFSNICTHLSCRVKWQDDNQQYVCPCHDAHFDINGNVLSGPPPRPMDTYEWKIEEGNILVHFVEG